MMFYLVYSTTGLLYTFFITLICTTIILKWYRGRNYPPGPIGIPVLGYALFLGKRPHEKFTDFSRKYGDVYRMSTGIQQENLTDLILRIIYLGPQLNIIISDYYLAKELLCSPKLLQRPEHFTSFLPGRGGFVGMNGEEWQEQRRFTFYTIRNLGLGKGLWETMIQEAVTEFIEDLKNLKGQPKNLEDVIGTFHSSNILSLLLGRHLDSVKDGNEAYVIAKSSKEFMKHLNQAAMLALVPWMRKMMEVFHLAGYNKFLKLLRKFEITFKKEVEERLKSPESMEKDDYIGCFYRELKKRESGTGNHTFREEILLGNLIVLFISSNDSSKATISWLLLYMAAFPDIQKRIHDEIDSVVGRDGVIYFDNKAKFPYTMATIFETLRHSGISPFTPPRTVTEDMTINGYCVPKGSYIMVNVWSILHDPRYFSAPEQFQPERFLADDKAIKTLDGFMPFSLGKRNCPGEGIAIMTAFLYFASFMQKFKVTMPPGKEVDLQPVSCGGGNLPKEQEICFLER